MHGRTDKYDQTTADVDICFIRGKITMQSPLHNLYFFNVFSKRQYVFLSNYLELFKNGKYNFIDWFQWQNVFSIDIIIYFFYHYFVSFQFFSITDTESTYTDTLQDKLRNNCTNNR